MRFAIPSAPRTVAFGQVPGAARRLVVSVAVALGLATGAGLGARAGARFVWGERRFAGRADHVSGLVRAVKRPPPDASDRTALVDVLYTWDDRQFSATGVTVLAADALLLGPGRKVELWVDPTAPQSPREAHYAQTQLGAVDLLPYGMGAGLLLGVGGVLWQLRRIYRSEVAPLRTGMLVWLTPAHALPQTMKETVFDASYYQKDVQHQVRARGRPGRAPVKKGDQVLAAVVPKHPRWVRVIDEDLARSLGWVE